MGTKSASVLGSKCSLLVGLNGFAFTRLHSYEVVAVVDGVPEWGLRLEDM